MFAIASSIFFSVVFLLLPSHLLVKQPLLGKDISKLTEHMFGFRLETTNYSVFRLENYDLRLRTRA